MFLGEFQHLVDPKGRVILPSKFRKDLEDGFKVTQGLEECLFIMPTSEFERLYASISELPLGRRDARAFARQFLSKAFNGSLDGQGRVLIPQNLRNYAHLVKDVIVIGVGSRAEIWDKKTWERYSKESEKSYSELAEKLGELGF